MLVYVLLLLLPVAMAMEGDQANIPHGYVVPDPCYSTIHWGPSGHINRFLASKDDLNQFGKDFKAAGFKWTRDLCMKDSDGDGRSNGYELGDDHCSWVPGQNVESPVRSHPGINEFYLSQVCPESRDLPHLHQQRLLQ